MYCLYLYISLFISKYLDSICCIVQDYSVYIKWQQVLPSRIISPEDYSIFNNLFYKTYSHQNPHILILFLIKIHKILYKDSFEYCSYLFSDHGFIYRREEIFHIESIHRSHAMRVIGTTHTSCHLYYSIIGTCSNTKCVT